ncbi:MAG: putative metal-binding motif-containing protein [Deltaproteobacteria bacterium]|nr:putative metal-binding motif-containing protein [Deltaproteobacteria bacterium]
MSPKWLWAGLFATLGCSAIVNPEELPILCDEDRACPEGMACLDGTCAPRVEEPQPDAGCEPNDEPELCNGLDDNCNDQVDEGHDVDGDGVTWCNGGNQEGRDCNDHDPLQAPGLEEACDGRDNDCDGRIDEDTCPAGGVCDPVKGGCADADPCEAEPCGEGFACEQRTTDAGFECVPIDDDDCRNEGVECPGDQFCDSNGRCADLRDLGGPCREDAECEEGYCADPQMLRMSVDESFCSRTCCSPDDCPGDFVCWQPGGGFSACVPRVALDLGEGAGAAGSACGGDSECASGACVRGSCGDPCCDGSSCGGQVCEVAITDAEGRNDELVTICGGAGQGEVGSGCVEHGECASGLCVPRDWEDGYCTAPCCASSDCGIGFVCAYVAVTDLDPEAQVRLCWDDMDWLGFPLHGYGDAGDACDSSAECRSDYCENGRCVDTCCSQTDCQGGSTCRVRPVPDGGQLLCLP